MKRFVALLLAALLCAVSVGCKKENERVYVFAAASLTETLTELAETYKAVAPDVELVLTFDSSGTLKTMIEEGADCDLFISAGQKQMNQLDLAADAELNPDRLDYVNPQSRCDLLENRVVLCVPEGNPKGIGSFAELRTALAAGEVLLAMGNGDVPVGQYTQRILQFYDLDEQALASAGCITYGGNVKEVTTQIKEGAADCGIVYQTDAFSAQLTVVDAATEAMCGRVVYPAAVLKTASRSEQAQLFLDYLKTPEAAAVFEKVGFTLLS